MGITFFFQPSLRGGLNHQELIQLGMQNLDLIACNGHWWEFVGHSGWLMVCLWKVMGFSGVTVVAWCPSKFDYDPTPRFYLNDALYIGNYWHRNMTELFKLVGSCNLSTRDDQITSAFHFNMHLTKRNWKHKQTWWHRNHIPSFTCLVCGM